MKWSAEILKDSNCVDVWPNPVAIPQRLTQDFSRILPTSMKSSTATTSSFLAMPLHMRQLLCSGFAENDEKVAVEDFIDVGNILDKSWLSLCHKDLDGNLK